MQKLFKMLAILIAIGLATMAINNIQPAKASTVDHVSSTDRTIGFDRCEFTNVEGGQPSQGCFEGDTYDSPVDDNTSYDEAETAYNVDDDECTKARRNDPDFFGYGCSIWAGMSHGGGKSPGSSSNGHCGGQS